ncbi:endonuclease/exonuclease/phosphatase [Formosa agariphila KMM 3901]|uniref:Endonuclease/exonuclease/phosphatase n=1 Tax=Formosa agariphila (strain DSM 15362 / KCTC 12365 / LMG 23005 / KMM 3901 / M-2Alg 35-1) TaxID=1347342 RepID=T2KR93_FORAG|nr:endonuclease/exonuclease/phosphatase family protein [Formosa agariphila]CDF80524.1 endonuclease/exonuclease/phosphatase [Formosa agariphila KMM 3901]
MIQFIFKYKAKAYLLFWYAFLLLIHFVLKDRISPLIFIFYACPLILVIAYGFLVSLSVYKHKVISIVVLCMNILVCIYWYNNFHYNTYDTTLNSAEQTYSIFYWNISRPDKLPLDIIAENIQTYNPEIIAFVEAKDVSEIDLLALKKQYPLYDIKHLEGEMLIAVQGKIDTVTFNKISNGSKSNLVTATIQDYKVTFLITDLLANPALSKRKDFKNMLSIVDSNPIDFVIGDFNTPYESHFFDSFKPRFESFHNYNNGFTGTWPSKLPLIEIDHMWLHNKWQPILLHKDFNSKSDHGLMVGKFKRRP